MNSQQDGSTAQEIGGNQVVKSASQASEAAAVAKNNKNTIVMGDIPITDHLCVRLRELMHERELSARTLSAKAGMGPTYVSDILNKKVKSLGAESLAKLANALGIQVTMLLETFAPYPQGHSQPTPPREKKQQPHRYVKISNRVQIVSVAFIAETGAVRIGGHIPLNRREIAVAPYDRAPTAKTTAVEARDWAMDRAATPIPFGYYVAVACFTDDFRPEPGMIVLARVKHLDGPEIILRRLSARDGHYMLTAESSEPALYPPLAVKDLSTDPASDISFIGKVYQIIGFPE